MNKKVLFRKDAVPSGFDNDYKVFLDLIENNLDDLLKVCKKNGYFITPISKSKLNKIADSLSIPIEDLDKFRRILIFFAAKIVEENFEPINFEEELNRFEYKELEIKNSLVIIKSLYDFRESVEKDLRKRGQQTSIIPTIRSFKTRIDSCAIYNNEDELIDIAPMIIVNLSVLTEIEKEIEITFQMDNLVLDTIIERLETAKKRIKELNNKVKIK